MLFYYTVFQMKQFIALLMPIQELQKAQSKLASAALDNHKKVMSAIEELKVMLTEQAKASFQVKGSHIEV